MIQVSHIHTYMYIFNLLGTIGRLGGGVGSKVGIQENPCEVWIDSFQAFLITLGTCNPRIL